MRAACRGPHTALPVSFVAWMATRTCGSAYAVPARTAFGTATLPPTMTEKVAPFAAVYPMQPTSGPE